ncbi:MAG: hypothetical protein ACI81O_002391, partial [Cyclobacteriaceae bacterium]
MVTDTNEFESSLKGVLVQHIPECRALVRVDRLSGGASQETYRIVVETSQGERLLA